MDLQRAQRAYLTDPAFHNAVVTMEVWIMQMAVTPNEVRDAAMLACYNVQCRNPAPPLFFTDTERRRNGS
jgi:hypothetical protein